MMKNSYTSLSSAHLPRAQKELTNETNGRESATLGLAVLDSIAAEIAVLSRDGTILAVNAAWRRFSFENGIEPGKPAPGTDVGANYLAVCQPFARSVLDGVNDAHDGVRAVLDGRMPSFSLEYPCHSPQEQRWFNLIVTPLGEAAVDGVVISHTNITKRIKIAQELNNVLAALDQHAIVATTNVNGSITSVNDKLCEISGYARNELLGQNHRRLSSRLHPKKFFEDMYRTITAGKVWHGEVRNQAKDGHFYWMQTTIAPFMDDDGVPIKYVSIRTDITASKENEMELKLHRDHLEYLVNQKTADLQKNERTLSDILENVDACIYLKDTHGRYLFANRPLCEMLGVPLEEIVGQNDEKFFDAATFMKIRKNDRAVLDQGKTFKEEETAHNLKDGHTSTYLSVKIPLSNEVGKIYALCGIYTDITERKRIEEAAHAANRAKSEFLANMSHEIRTPLNGVVGMVDILQKTSLQPEQQRMLGVIHNSSLALISILNDILDFSKIEAGKMELESIPTHLREVVEGVAQLMLSVAIGKDAQISLFVDPALPNWVFFDPTRLSQILLNLLGNALKFIAQGAGRAMLHVRPVLRSDGVAYVQFRVIDNGIGMSQEFMAKLFQPFTQENARTARKFGGTGLGLSITHRLVEMMHGEVSVHSKPGEGSEFIVEFPLLIAPAPLGRTLPVEPDLSGLRVLAVTPTGEFSNQFQVYLGAAGAHVTVVSNMQMARQHLQKSSGDTVLLLDLATDCGDVAGGQSLFEFSNDMPVVRLVRRGGGKAKSNEIEVMARPLLYHDLLHAIAVASGRIIAPDLVKQIERGCMPRTKTPSIEEASRTGRLILLAEDNETNRDVLTAQLSLLGYATEVALDGVQALAKWRTGRFALLLTDCHMPHMDGFELTEAIRHAEPQGTRLPIVAITANALQGGAERCRARGMDDYLSKPLRLNELGPMLAKWLPRKPEQPKEAPSEVPVIWDASTLGQLVGDDPIMHRRLLARFLINANEQVLAIGVAAAAGACSRLVTEAHTLKSAARSVGALALGELCQALESAGQTHDVQACGALAAGLLLAFSGVEENIQNHVALLPVD